MIPDYASGSPEQRLEFYRGLIQRIRHSSESHLGWYTHKNPYGCWICDLILVSESLSNLVEDCLADVPRGYETDVS